MNKKFSKYLIKKNVLFILKKIAKTNIYLKISVQNKMKYRKNE